jgi:hypothetical protein
MKTKAPASIEDHALVIAKRAEIATVETRLKQAELREAAARQRLRDLRPAVIGTADVAAKKASAASKVAKLLSGGVVSSADPKSELEAAEREQAILHEAQIELHNQLHVLIGEISDEYNVAHLGPMVRDGTLEVYENLAKASAAMVRMRQNTADAIRLGYRVSSVHCADYIPTAAWALGDPGNVGSALAVMRNALVTKGWLK